MTRRASKRATVLAVLLLVGGCGGTRETTTDAATGPPGVGVDSASDPSIVTASISASASAPGESAREADRTVDWLVETDPVPDDRDAADDPAIWFNVDNPADSLIIGTNKKGQHGLLVYDLAGRRVSSHDGGPMNNVDLRAGVALNGRLMVLVVATAVDMRELVLLELNTDSGALEPLSIETVDTGIRGGGLCLWQPDEATLFAFTTAGSGTVQQWALIADGQLDPTLVREIDLDSRVEGCVTDDGRGDVFLAEEAVGVWHISAAPDTEARPQLVDAVGGAAGLVADVEGMAIATYDDGRRYLVVSSQGNDRFVVYRLESKAAAEPIGTLHIHDPDGADDVTHTDGIDVVVGDFTSGRFAGGLFVVQDDDNDQPQGDDAHQNFKLVPWDAVEKAFAIE